MEPSIEEAKQTLGISDGRATAIEYSGRFSAYNGNVRADRATVTVRLAKEWRGRDRDAQQGLIEFLLAKLFRKKIRTPRMQLYRDFLLYVGREEKTKLVEDTQLQASFDRINAKYFGGQMELANLTWGRESFRKLGHYHYGSDTVLLSTVLLEEQRMLDFVMYHELLHKKHGITPGGRAHTKAFREDEAKYEEATEQELTRFVHRQKRSWF